MDALFEAPMEALTEVDEIGERIAGSLISFFADGSNLQLIDRLKNAGLSLESEDRKESISDSLDGETFVISGKFADYSRDELKEIVEFNGGKNVSSVSTKTSYVLAGENMGPEKYKKAEALKIPIISINEFLDMLNK